MQGFLFALFISALVSPLVIRLYRSKGWLSTHNEQRPLKNTHEETVPRGGGLVIITSILLASLLFLQFDSYLIVIMSGALILAITGFFDDLFDIHPVTRLLAGLFVALLVVGSGIGISYVSNPLGEGVVSLQTLQVPVEFFGRTRSIWILADLFALFFILWNMNIVNWSKGVDGQMPGFVSIAAIIIGILSFRFIDDPTQFNTAQLSFIVSGAYAGFLIWNWYPQKIMPGYGGGALAGYFLSILAILSGAKVATALMVLAVPTADAIFTVLRRIRAGKSPFWGDRGHMHHKMLDVLKWSKRRIAVFYWASSLILGLLSLYLNTTGKLITIGLVLLLVFAFLIWAKWKSLKELSAKN